MERHAFVLDDEEQVRTFIANVLRASGFVAHTFSTAAEVEAALTRLAPVLIVLDLSLGSSDAVEMLRSLASAKFSGHVQLVSGHDLSTLEQVKKVGEQHNLSMLPVLRKPLRLEALRSALKLLGGDDPAQSSEITLEAALRNNWLQLWYQPKIDLVGNILAGAEALIRLVHPSAGTLLPGAFLPPPGDPLYVPLTDFIVRRSLSDWLAFAGRGLTQRIAINVPASVLQRPDFVRNLRAHLPRHQNFPGLIVELTEDEALTDVEAAREIAIQLKLYNVLVSIDDFGAGHSSLSRLAELPFAELKVDRKYVIGSAIDKEKQEVCRAVAALARQFGIVSVAEGIENPADLSVVVGAGYNLGQGYLFAKPMPAEEFITMLERKAGVRQ